MAPVIGRDGFDVLRLGRRIAAELAGEAVYPAAPLTMADRFALVTLSLAVETEAARRAGTEPVTERARVWLAEQLAAVERAALPTHSEPLTAAG